MRKVALLPERAGATVVKLAQLHLSSAHRIPAPSTLQLWLHGPCGVLPFVS